MRLYLFVNPIPDLLEERFLKVTKANLAREAVYCWVAFPHCHKETIKDEMHLSGGKGD